MPVARRRYPKAAAISRSTTWRESSPTPRESDYDPVYIGYFRAFGTLFQRKAMEFATTNIGGNAWANAF